MYVYNVRAKKVSMFSKLTKKAKSNLLTLGMMIALVVGPPAAIAKSGINNPTVSTTSSFSIRIATTDITDNSVSLSGSANISNFSGREDGQYIKISWGDGQTSSDLFMNYPSYLKSSKSMTLSKWTATHNYATADNSNTITAKVYHGGVNGIESYPGESSDYTVQTENTDLACSNSGDDDRDGATDLADSDCKKFVKAEDTAQLCGDGIDNNLDGTTDLSDPTCAAFIPKEDTVAVCTDGKDNDLDGLRDGMDSDCAGLTPAENTAQLCGDGIDNNLNGKIDLKDPSCSAFVPKENTEATCTDGIDNDLDGLPDGWDSDCAGLTPAENTEATCLDGKDNDLDGSFDWNDSDCAAFVVPMNCPVGFQKAFIPGFGFICGAAAGY